MRITRVTATVHTVDLPRRGLVPLAGGAPVTAAAVSVVLARVETDAGRTGTGFTTLAGPGAAAVLAVLESEVAPLVVGEPAWDFERLFAKAEHHFAPVGFAGVVARAYAPVDVALWDLCGQAAGVPVSHLLGNASPGGARFFISDPVGTGWDAGDVAKLTKSAIKDGAMGVRVGVGGANVQADADRVRDLHDALGEDAWLGVSGGGRYDLPTALALAHFFEDQGVDWFEDPLPAADLAGYERLAAKLELPVAVGADFDRAADFLPFLRSGLARVIRPDVSRLGGITPVRNLAAAAGALHVAVAPVRLPEVGAHLGAGLAAVSLVDRVPWLAGVLTGGPTPAGGKLAPPAAPGLGVIAAAT